MFVQLFLKPESCSAPALTLPGVDQHTKVAFGTRYVQRSLLSQLAYRRPLLNFVWRLQPVSCGPALLRRARRLVWVAAAAHVALLHELDVLPAFQNLEWSMVVEHAETLPWMLAAGSELDKLNHIFPVRAGITLCSYGKMSWNTDLCWLWQLGRVTVSSWRLFRSLTELFFSNGCLVPKCANI